MNHILDVDRPKFDGAGRYPPNFLVELGEIATEVRLKESEATDLDRKMALNMMEIGRLLAKALDGFNLYNEKQMGEGEPKGFEEWLKREFKQDRSYAYKYIKFYTKYRGDVELVPHGPGKKALFALAADDVDWHAFDLEGACRTLQGPDPGGHGAVYRPVFAASRGHDGGR